ncbi:MAG: hypothetical protein AAB801_02815, partial [Patescibacteria group bacterium]
SLPRFEQRLEGETAYIQRQLKTDLGERLDVSESTVIYEIRNGKLFEPGRNKPFIDVIKRGMGRREIDLPRERADLQSFRTIETVLGNDEIPDGTTILEVSPRGLPGSNYEKNVFDIHTKISGQVITTRYLSNLTNEEYRRKIISLNPGYSELLPERPTDVALKSNPLIIPSHLDYSDPDKLAKYLLKERVGMPAEELDEIWSDSNTVMLYTSYVNTLVENPESLFLEVNYRAFLNMAHKLRERKLSVQKIEITGKVVLYSADRQTPYNFSGSRMEIEYLAEEPLKIGGGACGSGSCSTNSSESVPSSTLDNIDGKGQINFRCPSCGEINSRTLFNLLTNCQHCGSKEVLPKFLRGYSKLS